MVTSKKTTQAEAKPASKKKVASKKTAAKPAAGSKTAKAAQAARGAPASSGHTVVDGIAPYQQAEGEEYMSPAMIEHFRRILNAWRDELYEEMNRTVHHMQDEAANFPDPNDRATQESEFSLELRTRDRERKLIKKISESLKMLDSGDYGYCESCGVEIGVRRLEARPTASQCIDCKELDEIRERQIAG